MCSSDQEAWLFVARLIALYKSILFFTSTSTRVNSLLFGFGKFHLQMSRHNFFGIKSGAEHMILYRPVFECLWRKENWRVVQIGPAVVSSIGSGCILLYYIVLYCTVNAVNHELRTLP
jgi:hypothetical protein